MITLILKANTNSEWDGVDFAIVDITKEFIDFLKEAMEDAQNMKHKYSHGFLGLRFSGDNAEWFCGDEEGHTLLGDEEFVIVEKTLDTSKYQRPEQDIRYGQIKITGDSVQFVGYGKHTSEEFWTESISIEEIIKYQSA